MANNENLLRGKATQFSSENQPENRGRKPSALRFIRDEGVSITDIRRIIDSLIWNYDSEELADLLKTKKVKVQYVDNKGKTRTKTVSRTIEPLPMGVNLILGALADDQQKKRLVNYKLLHEQVHGKPTQPVDVKPPGLSFTTLTPEERDKRIEELLKQCELGKSNG